MLEIELEENILSIVKSNNEIIRKINDAKNKFDNKLKDLRKEICKSIYNDLLNITKKLKDDLSSTKKEIKKVESEIKSKKEQQKISKKDKVAETIKKILNYFFSDKYYFDEKTFRLVFKSNILLKSQAKHVLSEGEKSIIAFAYFMGDIHLKVSSTSDYEKVFYIIDDPISSMDFNHVYTICGVIRDLKSIIPEISKERFILFTHNIEFMRLISSNNIISHKFVLKNNKITPSQDNLTVPYLYHLLDVYKISNKLMSPNHTTANSIRHIIETLVKFENLVHSKELIADYIKSNISNNKKTYTLINDLSHGAWRDEQLPVDDSDYVAICETIIELINNKFPFHIAFCKNNF